MSDHPRDLALSSERQALAALRKMRQRIEELERGAAEPIAIVGMACRFPGASDLDAFWRELRDGVDAIRVVPADRWDIDSYYDADPDAIGKIASRHGGFLDAVDRFDPDFFGIAPREAVSMDPQHRLLLEVAWEALEHAAIAPQDLTRRRTGVYVGISIQDYWQLQVKRCAPSALNAYFGTGNALSAAAGHLSYLLGLQGPSMSVDTACSSSLVAVHLACQALRTGDCRAAFAGGVNLLLAPEVSVALSRAHMLAPDGRCKTFDARANGFVRSEGCGVIILKSLSDARADGDRILAIIRGSAVNQDGRSGGFTAPNELSQRSLIEEALSRAGLRPSDIDYVEAHGTGTSLGDPIEVQALAAALREGRTSHQPLVVGSVKTNIGHLEAAAGIAGLIKTVLAMEHGHIPPSLHFETVNPHIACGDFPWTVPTSLRRWDVSGRPRRAGVSSFGFTGTNAHVILEAVEGEAVEDRSAIDRPVHLLAMSAKTPAALRALAGGMADRLASVPDSELADVCFSANAGRAHFEHRLAVTGASGDEARRHIAKWTQEHDSRAAESVRPGAPEITFLFAGQGAQHVGMGRELYRTQPVFRSAFNRADEIVGPQLGRSLSSVLYGDTASDAVLDDTAFTQPALFTLECALVELWRSWGIEPTAVMGHSLGEDVAACVAGVFGFEDGLRMVAERGRLMQQLPDEGVMVAVLADEARVRTAVAEHGDDVSIAAINGPENLVISGVRRAVDAVVAELHRGGAKVRPLRCSRACHSRLMDPVLDDVERLAGAMTYAEPEMTFVSTVTGREISRDELATTGHWRRHIRETVRFREALEALVAKGQRIFVEIGPGATAIGMGRRALRLDDALWVPSLGAGHDTETMLKALGALYMRGVDVNWNAFDAPFRRARVALPSYPFQRQRYWVETLDRPLEASITAAIPPAICDVRWIETPRDSREPAQTPGDWLLVASTGTEGADLAARLRERGARCTLLDTDPANLGDLRAAWRAMPRTPGATLNVVHLAGSVVGAGAATLERLEESTRAECAGLLHLVQVMTSVPGEPSKLWVVTRGAQVVSEHDRSVLEHAALNGLTATIAREHPELSCRHVDVDDEGSVSFDALADELTGSDAEDRVALRGAQRFAARLAISESVDRSRTGITVRSDATYLITGGCGGLGLSVADWLIEHGARSLILTGRKGAVGEAARRVEALRARGARVEIAQGDVADAAFVARLIASTDTATASLKGIVHAAGVLDDAPIGSQSWERFERVMSPKLRGAWLLHEHTRGLPLDFFVMFSSAASLFGTPGQANYAAANAFLDGFAVWRRRQRLAAQSIGWGPWAETGMAASLGEREKSRWEAQGIRLIAPADALAAFGALIASERPQAVVVSAAWPTLRTSLAGGGAERLLSAIGKAEDSADADLKAFRARLDAASAGSRPAIVLEHIREHAAQVLGVAPATTLNVARGLRDLGLDSLMSLELRNRLQRSFGVSLAATVAFDFPTVEALTGHVSDQLSLSSEPLSAARRASHDAPRRQAARDRSEPIAIVGVACRFPGSADSPEAFWQLLRGGVDAITEVPPDRWDADAFYHPDPAMPGKMYTRFGGFVDHIDRFEPQFFGIAPREAATMDPQQRMLLEVAWEALERAGQSPARLAGTPTGVFTGVASGDYTELLKQNPPEDLDAYFGTGTSTSVAAGRLSYVLGLQGPSMVVDTACSSSLVAVHLACQSLRGGECDLALAGGVSALLSPHGNIALSRARMMAPDGRCKTFDESADGYVRSEGCGLVVLKRLSDARADGDQVLALVLGSAVNQDGRSSGLTAPNGPSQQALLRRALADAGVKPADVSYVEAHGTGTSLGDPIELQGIGAVFGEDRSKLDPVRVGSVKTNLGHLEAAAGVAGLIKVVLSLQHGEIPPHLHLRTPNHLIDWDRLPVRVPVIAEPWISAPSSPRIAGVSSFGFSGTNAHVVVASAPETNDTREQETRSQHLLTLSARTASALKTLARGFAAHLEADADLPAGDVCFTANSGRAHLSHRMAVVGATTAELTARLKDEIAGTSVAGTWSFVVPDGDRPKLAMLFTGQGAQYVGMGRRLYETQPTFRESLDRSADILRPLLDRPLLSVLYPSRADAALIDETAYTQPALFAIEYALAELWRSWGIEPSVVMGHSVGEYVAACIAGVFNVEDGLRLIAARGRLMQSLPRTGAMAAVLADARVTRDLVGRFGGRLAIAAENGPQSAVISGEASAVAEAMAELAARGVESQRLAVSHAFHSALMDPILEEFETIASGVAYAPPRIDIVSNVTGELAAADEITKPGYWTRHLRQTVRFADGVAVLAERGHQIFLEAGPNPVLLGMARRIVADPDSVWLPSLRAGGDEWKQMVESAAALYVRGIEIDWTSFDRDYPRRKITLPTYPFERERYWAAPTPRALDESRAKPSSQQPAVPTVDAYAVTWTANAVESAAFDLHLRNGAVLVFADRSGVASDLLDALRANGNLAATVDRSDFYMQTGLDSWSIRPEAREDFSRLLSDLQSGGLRSVSDVLFLWPLDADSSAEMTGRDLEWTQMITCGAVLSLVQALHEARIDARLRIVTRNVHPVGSDHGALNVAQSPVWGLGRVIGVEHPELWGGLIDLDSGGDGAGQILAELSREDDEDQVAFRNGRRYVPRLERAETIAGGAGLRCRGDASYLITGGLGLLGLKLARHLVERGARRLVLLGRSGLPDRSQWDSIAEGSELRRQIDAVRALESLGAGIDIAAVDVADETAMSTLFARFGSVLPPLGGVVHAASAMDGVRLSDMSREALFGMLRPKVLGTWTLCRLVESQPIDFLILFSSISAWLGSIDMGHYAAANSFLDAVAHDRRAKGLKAISINWGSWDAMRGKADRRRTFERSGMRAMDSDRALATLDRVVAGGRPQIVVADVEWPTFKMVYGAKRRRPFLEAIDASVAAPLSSSPVRDVAAELEGVSVEDRLPLLRSYIREEAAGVLGLPAEEIDSRKGLFDLGMDSLMSVELKRRLEAALHRELPTTLTFKYPTVSALADFLDGQIAAGNGHDRERSVGRRSPEPAVDDHDDLSEDELASMLAERLEQIR